jgi:hypothetical protein
VLLSFLNEPTLSHQSEQTRSIILNNLTFLKMKKFFYLFLLLCSPFTIEAATITVTSGDDAGAGTLRAAISSAVAGDDIVFSGVTTVTLTSAELLINKNLTINGGTGVTITRSGITNFRIFNISGATTTVVFNKLNITNGKATNQAGGVQNTANLTLNDCIIANNEAPQGGGLQNDNVLTMNRCFVYNNTMTAGGGGCGLIIYSTNSTTLNNCVFTNNQMGWAIDIQSTGTLNITNCTIAKNTGGINVGKSTAVVTLKNTIVAENTTGTNANILNNNVNASSAYNLIGTEGGNGGLTNGTNNNKVGVSPLFANSSDPDGADNIFGTADDGLRLTACNFATNVGNNADAPSGTDILGNLRIFATTVDIGAYEFQANATPVPTITLGTISPILAGATTFPVPYTATTSAPTTYSVSGTGITTVTDAALPSSSITVNLSSAASGGTMSFTLTVKNANGCTSTATTGFVVVYTPISQACATATFNGTAPIAPTATAAGVGGRGGIHTYTVPAGVTAIRIDARGAKGGNSPITGGGTYSGGNGGRVQATYAVTPGDVLNILVGGKGGDGSLDNGVNDRTASGGGGATVISKGAIGTGTLLLVAGGGGGAGHSGAGGQSNNLPGNGAGGVGAGGASFSTNGGNSTVGDDCGAGGKALNAGGNGGANTCFKPETNGGGYGGGGAGNYSIPNGNAGGGGGGGYVGGNAGGTSGGNGGSSYTEPSATNIVIGNSTDDNGSVSIVIVGGTHTITWTGAVSTDWNTPCNWSPSGVPTVTNPVIIPATTNKPVISSGTSVAKSVLIDGLGASLTVNNGATLTASKIDITQGQIINNACGTIKVTGDYANNGTATTTNQGFILINGVLNNAGTFTNTGVLKYTTLTGTITNNQASSVIVRNLTYPIFNYGGTFSGTINGIFTDSLAALSAGTFAAPFAFTPLATLSRGIQTLYVKITPNGGACSYTVPFSYNTLTSSVSKVDAETLALHQNHPNPFSQETIVSFDLSETNKAVLTVFDINGRQVFTSNQGFKTGYNEVILHKSIFQTSGTYFYRLTTDKAATVKRLQFVAD